MELPGATVPASTLMPPTRPERLAVPPLIVTTEPGDRTIHRQEPDWRLVGPVKLLVPVSTSAPVPVLTRTARAA